MEVLQARTIESAPSNSLLDEVSDVSARLARTGKVIAEGVVVGTYESGKDRVKNHLPELLLEVGTAAGLGALAVASIAASPVIAGAIVTGVAIAGTAIIAKNIGKGFYDSAPALKAAWSSPLNEAYAREQVAKNVGPIVLDLAVATAGGIAGGVTTAGAASRVVPNYYTAKLLKPGSFKTFTVHDAASAGSNSSYVPNIQTEVLGLARSRLIRVSTLESSLDKRSSQLSSESVSKHR